MGAQLNRLISLGGTSIKSPAQRYQQAKKDYSSEQTNRLARMSTQQGMDINNQKMQMLKQEEAYKGMAALGDRLDTIKDPAQRAQALQASIPNFQQSGIPAVPQGMPIEQIDAKIKQAQLRVNGVKETFSPIIEDGNVVAQKSNTSGRVYKDPRAPEKTEVGTPGEFTAGSKSNRFKLNEKRRIAEISAMRSVKGNNELISLIDDPNWVGGVASDAISVVNSLSQQMANLSGVKQREYKAIPDKDVSADAKSQFSGLRKKARAGDRYAAAKIEMAYVNAKRVDPASKITDKDFAFADKMLGSGGDKSIIKEILIDGSNRAINTYNDGEDITGSRNSRYETKRISDDRRSELLGVSPVEPQTNKDPSQEFDPDAWLEEAGKL